MLWKVLPQNPVLVLPNEIEALKALACGGCIAVFDKSAILLPVRR
jgi:hypothetical protein